MRIRSLNSVLVAALLILSASVCPVLSAEHKQTQSSQDANRAEAERLWELAIAAKGGRERLHAANNLQISINEKVWYGLKRVSYIREALYVFPGKFWEWNDQQKTVFGLSIRMYNHDRDIDLWYTDHGKGARVARPIDLVHGKAGLIPIYDAQLRYFMETRWVKPIPINVHEEKLDGKTVDIVQTIVKGYPTKDGTDEQRVGFAFDRKTHLPIKIIYYRVVQGKEHSGGLPLSDYVDVDGNQMPSKILDLKSSFKVNVDYDEQIFVREPSVEGGIKQWEKK